MYSISLFRAAMVDRYSNPCWDCKIQRLQAIIDAEKESVPRVEEETRSLTGLNLK